MNKRLATPAATVASALLVAAAVAGCGDSISAIDRCVSSLMEEAEGFGALPEERQEEIREWARNECESMREDFPDDFREEFGN